jgi:prephenate dehydratase
VFDRVERGENHYGILPLEHSMQGSVHEHYDLLLEGKSRIVGEITLRIIHCLAAKPGTTLKEIHRVVSDPTVLRHCDRFLDEYPDWQRVTVQDIATAAKQVHDQEQPGTAAITTPEAAERYGLEVLEGSVATNPRSYTRFAVLSSQPEPHRNPRKTSLVYQVPDRPGALLRILSIFSDHKINLVKLESRPLDSRPWEYMFYVDVEANIEAPEHETLREQLRDATDYLKILGCY